MAYNTSVAQVIRNLLLPLSSLLSGAGMLVVGVGLLFSVLGLRADLANFPTVVTGLIMSAYFVGYIVGTYICPAIIHKVGHIRTFAAMASIASTMPILHALWIDPWFWGALRLLTGICLVGLYIVIESWLNALAPIQHRGKIFSVYMSVTFIALAVGQWLILVGDPQGFIQFALVSILFSFALIPITLTPIDQPPAVSPPQLNLRDLYKISPLGLSVAVGSGLLNGAFYGMGAVYAHAVGFSDLGVATFMASTILGGAIFQWPVGHFSDTHDRRYVMLWVCIASAGLAVLGFLFSRISENALVILGILYGGMVFTLYGLSVAHVNDMIGPSRVLEVTGGLLLLHGIGAAFGPTLAGVVMNTVGPASLMLYFALVLGLLALYAVKRINAAPAVPETEKSHYVALSGSTPVALQVDPLTAMTDEDISEPDVSSKSY